MRTLLLVALGALALAGCGDGADQPDTYKGFIDGSVLDTKFLPGKCGSTPCYPSQNGFVQGKAIAFYNLGSLTTASLPVIKASALPAVFDFPGQRCRAPTFADPTAAAYDPLRDAYDASKQLPLFAALPLATKTTGVVVNPFVNVAPIISNTLFTCNDVKDATWVAWNGSTAGKYSLTADTVAEVQLRAVLDPTAPLAPGAASLTLATQLAWYKDLLLTYLDGGPVPVNDAGELQAMDGVILDPAGSTSFAKPTDANVVILPFARGQVGYSPIVRLHDFRLPVGKVAGDYTGICNGTGCGPKDVNFTQAAATAVNTLFIVTQQ